MPNLTPVFPHNPEQWIYAKAAEIEMSLPKIGKHTQMLMSDECLAKVKLEMEIHCLKRAIKQFNDLFTKFKENLQNAQSI